MYESCNNSESNWSRTEFGRLTIFRTKLSRFTIFWIKLGQFTIFEPNSADLRSFKPNTGTRTEPFETKRFEFCSAHFELGSTTPTCLSSLPVVNLWYLMIRLIVQDNLFCWSVGYDYVQLYIYVVISIVEFIKLEAGKQIKVVIGSIQLST